MVKNYESHFCTFNINGKQIETEFRLITEGDREMFDQNGNSYEIDYPLIQIFLNKKRQFVLFLNSFESKDSNDDLKEVLLFAAPYWTERKLHEKPELTSQNVTETIHNITIGDRYKTLENMKESLAGETYQQRSDICYEDLLRFMKARWRNPQNIKSFHLKDLFNNHCNRRIYEESEWKNVISWADGDEYLIIKTQNPISKNNSNNLSRFSWVSYHINGKKIRELEERLRASEPSILPSIFARIDVDHSFSFINDANLRDNITRDCKEINAAAQSGSAKSVIVLCGSVIEAVLYDLLKKDETKAQSEALTLKQKSGDIFDKAAKKPLNKWEAFVMIKVAHALYPDKLNNDAVGYADVLRDYRNFIHPAKEERAKRQIDHHTAAIAMSVVNLVIKGLK